MATKPRDRNRLGAACRIDCAAAASLAGSTQRFQALAQHFAALAERRSRDLLEHTAVAGLGGGRGISRTTEDVTFGCGTKAAGEMSNRILVSARQFASTPSRP